MIPVHVSWDKKIDPSFKGEGWINDQLADLVWNFTPPKTSNSMLYIIKDGGFHSAKSKALFIVFYLKIFADKLAKWCTMILH